MELSVLVVGHRRPGVLARCLDHLAAQTGAPDHEIVVVIDGDADFGEAELDRRSREGAAPLTWSRVPHGGHPAALNAALRRAHGRLVLILGDDIFASPDLLARHAARHRALNDPRAAVQGHVDWHPEVLPNPFLEWDRRAGVLFAYPQMTPHAFVHPRHFYTNNVSLFRAFLEEAGGFDGTLPVWGDTEFAWRAARRGLRLYYDPDCRALHHDDWTLEREARRRRRKGAIAARILVADPEFASFVTLPRPGAWRAARYRVSRALRPLAERLGPAPLRDWCWIHELHWQFTQGFREGQSALCLPDPPAASAGARAGGGGPR